MSKTVDCVFITVPFTDTIQPLMAPAILKSIALKAGKTATTIDLNALFINHLNDLDKDQNNKLVTFFKQEKCQDDETYDTIFEILKHYAQKIVAFSPKVVGISVFSYDCRIGAKYLSWFIKKLDPSIKIILGGAGIIQNFAGKADYAEALRLTGAIDGYIYGDAEKALYHYLSTGNDRFVGINASTWLQLTREEIELLPRPDFRDYDFSLYARNRFQLPLLGSRGCVRQCTFCDYHVHWEKFTYRGGEHIFNEIISFNQEFGTKHFHFTDSLINGNLREYRILTKLLSEHNQNLPEQDKITWGGFFIFRPKNLFTEKDWELTTSGGARYLTVGIESTSDEIRKQLGKNFSNEDIEFNFQMSRKFGAKTKFNLLFFTGYPTETDADYEFQVNWWKEQVKNQDVINSVNTGTPLGVLENTPLQQNFEKLGLVKIGPAPEDWINPANGNTPERRVVWNDMIKKTVEELGFVNVRGHDAHYIIERMRAGQ